MSILSIIKNRLKFFKRATKNHRRIMRGGVVSNITRDYNNSSQVFKGSSQTHTAERQFPLNKPLTQDEIDKIIEMFAAVGDPNIVKLQVLPSLLGPPPSPVRFVIYYKEELVSYLKEGREFPPILVDSTDTARNATITDNGQQFIVYFGLNGYKPANITVPPGKSFVRDWNGEGMGKLEEADKARLNVWMAEQDAAAAAAAAAALAGAGGAGANAPADADASEQANALVDSLEQIAAALQVEPALVLAQVMNAPEVAGQTFIGAQFIPFIINFKDLYQPLLLLVDKIRDAIESNKWDGSKWADRPEVVNAVKACVAALKAYMNDEFKVIYDIIDMWCAGIQLADPYTFSPTNKLNTVLKFHPNDHDDPTHIQGRRRKHVDYLKSDVGKVELRAITGGLPDMITSKMASGIPALPAPYLPGNEEEFTPFQSVNYAGQEGPLYKTVFEKTGRFSKATLEQFIPVVKTLYEMFPDEVIPLYPGEPENRGDGCAVFLNKHPEIHKYVAGCMWLKYASAIAHHELFYFSELLSGIQRKEKGMDLGEGVDVQLLPAATEIQGHIKLVADLKKTTGLDAAELV